MKQLVLAANWKMNLSTVEIPAYFSEFTKNLSPKVMAKFVFAVPNVFFDRALQATSSCNWQIAAQNVHEAPSGAFTGETSLPMLTAAGINTVLIGHSERRQYFAETDESVARKVAAATASGFTVIACVGETLQQRQKNETKAVITRQMQAITDHCRDASHLMIAYEPVWAIGTGVTASSTQASEVHDMIRSLLTAWNPAQAKTTPILYGGSVKAENVAELVAMPNIDGALVGGASLSGAAFAKLANAASLNLR